MIVNLNLENTGLKLKGLCEKLAEKASQGLLIIVEPREEALQVLTDAAALRVSEEEALAKLAGELNSLAKEIPVDMRRNVEAELVESLNRIVEYLHAEKKAG
ncbi:MAG: hypothetical protein QXF21_06215, partial [Thermoproteota archaeon]